MREYAVAAGANAILVLCQSSALAMTPAELKAAKAEIMAIEKDLALATTVDEVFTHFDPNVTLYDVFAGEKRGVTPIKNTWHEQLDNFTDYKSDILRIAIEVDGRLAFAYSTQHFTAKPKASGQPAVDYVFRQTDCYHRVDGKWLIIHQHLSLPVDGATDQAIRNSK